MQTCGRGSLNSTRFVITGGPGAGKTALIEALAAAGHGCSVEAGRAIIRDQLAIGGRALPWVDRAAFAEMMLCWEIRSHRMADKQIGPVFFDRGVPDVMGYLRLCGLPVPAHVDKAAEVFPYDRRVFVALPWAALFTRDADRLQDFADAAQTCAPMVDISTARRY